MSSATLHLRLAQRTDLPQLLTLLPHLTSNPQKVAAAMPTLAAAQAIFDQQQRQGNIQIIVAEVGEHATLVGTATLLIIPNLTYDGRPWAMVENIVVHRAHRRAGIGARLMDHAVALAREQGCYKLQLISGPKAEQRDFYRRLGLDDTHCRGFKYYL